MRAAAIFGLGTSQKSLKPFQKNSGVEWTLGLPGTSADCNAVVIFGGDGTVHRHLSPLVKLGLPVLVVPVGSGNDFARALGFKNVGKTLAAWTRFTESGKNVHKIDLGLITPLKPSRETEP